MGGGYYWKCILHLHPNKISKKMRADDLAGCTALIHQLTPLRGCT